MHHRVFIAIALVCSVYLCIEVTTLGVDKYYYVLASGNGFPTFFNLRSQVSIGLSYFVLNGLYLFWLWQQLQLKNEQQAQHQLSLGSNLYFSSILAKTSLFLFLSWLAYPLGNDVYLYLHTGLMNFTSVNPFVTPIGEFKSVFSLFVDWLQPSTYGPISQILFSVSALAVPIHPILAVYLFKAVCLGAHVLSSYSIWRLVPQSHRSFVTIAYLVHPLLLFEQVASAHVDVLVSLSLVLFVVAMLNRLSVIAFTALWAGLLAKTLPLIWMPLTLVFLTKQRRWASLVAIGLVSFSLITLLSLTVFPQLIAWRSLLNPGVTGQYQASLHAIARFGLDVLRMFIPSVLTFPQQERLLQGFTRLTLVGFTAIYAGFMFKVCCPFSSQRPLQEPAQQQLKLLFQLDRLLMALGWITLTLFLLATPWLMPWYASTLVTFTATFYALLKRQSLAGTLSLPNALNHYRFILTSLAFSFSSSVQYLIQGNNTVKSFVSIGLPVLVFVLTPMFLRQSVENELIAERSVGVSRAGVTESEYDLPS